MRESKDYLEMTFRSINCFADDGTLEAGELAKLFDIAKRDGVVDDNEKRVLINIIKKIKPSELDDAMLQQLEEIKAHISL